MTRGPAWLLQFAPLGGPVAQRLVQGTHNPLVVGSNPTGPMTSQSVHSGHMGNGPYRAHR